MTKRGFTLIEVIVAVAIIALMAGLVMPNFFSQQKTRQATSFFVALPDLAGYAREQAESGKLTTRIRYDDGNSVFVVTRDPALDSNDQETTLRQLPLPSILSTSAFRADDGNVTSGDWEIVFYPDGRSNGAAIEIDDNGRYRSLVVDPEGTIRMIVNSLPAVEERRWQAGEIEQRGGSGATGVGAP